ncbi:TetR/AcrR family transcriptional regulator [Demequina aurantiaca]|uniref:TetR/AcrR family transcriptional regulator n=1 Tax=Demequina aurantiaca TaxID=676200 RepID=UPI003D3249D2
MNTDGRRARADERIAQTRDQILASFASLLEDNLNDEITMGQIATRAGVTARTVHRHFPARSDLVAAFGDWCRVNLLPVIPLEKLSDLPGVIAQASAYLDRNPNLSRALAQSSVGQEVMKGYTEDFLAQLTQCLDEANPTLDPVSRRRVLAALHYLNSFLPWVVLKDAFDMDGDEVADVVGWVMELIIDTVDAPR